MSNPKFSVVIPTNERAETLRYTLKTCLAQQFNDYEIIVFDNCSSAAVRGTVESLNSPKIKYFRSEKPLAIADSFETAVSLTSGEYIITLGSDDGLLFYTLKELNRLFDILKAKILCWKPVEYWWPEASVPTHRNIITIKFDKNNSVLYSKKVILDTLNSPAKYRNLPLLYRDSAFHKDLIELLRKKSGRVFNAYSYDIYSGFAVAGLLDSYIVLGTPMTIEGVSKNSAGVLGFCEGRKSSYTNPILEKPQSAFKFHPKIPFLNQSVSALVADSFQYAKGVFFPDDPNFFIDRKQLVMDCLKDIALLRKLFSKEEWADCLKTIRESLADNVRLQKWFDYEVIKMEKLFLTNEYPYGKHGKDSLPDVGFKSSSDTLILDARKFGISDIFGVAKLCDSILNVKEDEFLCSAEIPKIAPPQHRSSLYGRLRCAWHVLTRGYLLNELIVNKKGKITFNPQRRIK